MGQGAVYVKYIYASTDVWRSFISINPSIRARQIRACCRPCGGQKLRLSPLSPVVLLRQHRLAASHRTRSGRSSLAAWSIRWCWTPLQLNPAWLGLINVWYPCQYLSMRPIEFALVLTIRWQWQYRQHLPSGLRGRSRGLLSFRSRSL